MSRLTVTVLAAALALTLPTTATAQEDPETMEEAVKSMRDAYFGTYESADAAEAASYFAEDGVLMPPTSSTVRGSEQIKERLEGFLGSQTISLQGLSEKTVVTGDQVLDRGMLAIEVTPKGSDQTTTDTGKYVLLAVQETNEAGESAWRLKWLIWNTDHPIAADEGEG